MSLLRLAVRPYCLRLRASCRIDLETQWACPWPPCFFFQGTPEIPDNWRLRKRQL